MEHITSTVTRAAAVQIIIAGTAQKPVRACLAKKSIVTGMAANQIRATAAHNLLCSGSAMQLHAENQISRDDNAVCLGIIWRKHAVNGGGSYAGCTIRLNIGNLIGGCAKPAKHPYLAVGVVIDLDHQITAILAKRQPLQGNAAAEQQPVGTAMAVVNLVAAAVSTIDIGVVALAAGEQISAGAGIKLVIAVAAIERVVACAAIKQIIAVAAIEQVITHIAYELIITAQAVQGVIAFPAPEVVGGGVAGEHIVQLVAVATVNTAGQHQVLHIIRQKIRALIAANLGINAFICRFHNGVAGHSIFIRRTISVVGVIPCTACHAVDTCSAIQYVVAAVPHQLVIQLIAGGIQIGCAQKHAPFQVRDQMDIQTGFNGVVAAVCGFNNTITRILDHVDIVARTALHAVNAGSAIQAIIALATQKSVIPGLAIKGAAAVIGGQDIVQLITSGHGVPGIFQQGQMLHMLRQGIAAACPHRIYAFSGQLHHHIAWLVNNIHIITQATAQAVLPCVAIQGVVARLTKKLVISGIAKQLIRIHTAIYTVSPISAVQKVSSGIAIQPIITSVAVHAVCAFTTSQMIVAVPAMEDIITSIAKKLICACSAEHKIRAATTRDRIRARTCIHRIVAIKRIDKVIGTIALNHIGKR